jgi:riboflavin kinase/FMN adenylyltransferase
VYAAWATVGGARYPAAVSVGTNPVFTDEDIVHVEAHILDRPEGESLEDFNLYGKMMTLDFVEFQRDQVSVSSVEELIDIMDNDKQEIKKILSSDLKNP